MIHWLHHLLNPHCDSCRSERQEDSICQTCEVLRSQVERVNFEKDKLLAQLERMTNPSVETEAEQEEVHKSVGGMAIAWAVKKRLLEAEDRAEAKVERERKLRIKSATSEKSIEDLEKEVGIAK